MNDHDLEAKWTKLRQKLLGYEVVLMHRGAPALKTSNGHRFWTLRLPIERDGRTVSGAIYIGREQDVELLARTRALLRRLREPAHWHREIAASAAVGSLLNRFLERRLPALKRLTRSANGERSEAAAPLESSPED